MRILEKRLQRGVEHLLPPKHAAAGVEPEDVAVDGRGEGRQLLAHRLRADEVDVGLLGRREVGDVPDDGVELVKHPVLAGLAPQVAEEQQGGEQEDDAPPDGFRDEPHEAQQHRHERRDDAGDH
ncbi:MAG: hypothetical protein ACKOK8_17060, partial [Planctomycetia bacterium]